MSNGHFMPTATAASAIIIINEPYKYQIYMCMMLCLRVYGL